MAKAPVVRHREWRFLLREFTDAHPAMRTQSSKTLQFGLAAVASVARWLLLERPALLEKGHVTLLLPGASGIECADDGRWFAFLPWLLGMPTLTAQIHLVGPELTLHTGMPGERRPLPGNATAAAAVVARYPKAMLLNGTLKQWRASMPDASVDACILFSPGFSTYYKSWFADGELGDLLAQVPLAMFSYSRMDALEDQEVLRLLGFKFTARELCANPWGLEHAYLDAIGGYAHYPWSLDQVIPPAAINLEDEILCDFLSLQHFLKEDAERFGPDVAMVRLSKALPIQKASRPDVADWLYIFPGDIGVLKSSGMLGTFDEVGFSPFAPVLSLPLKTIESRPEDDDTLGCVTWSLRTYRDVVAPLLAAQPKLRDVSSLFGDVDEELDELIEQLSSGELDMGEDFLNQMRVHGGIHGPTHPCWFDMLDTLGWAPIGFEEEPDRFEAAFSVAGRHAPAGLPVVCEAYAYFPDDADDELANDAIEAITTLYPEGALLVFRSMPYKEIEGHKYSFGGLLYWQRKWHQFALTPDMNSLDAVIDQALSGFKFDAVNPLYADDDTCLAVPFNRMCFGLDPNELGPMMGLKQGTGWVTLIPG